jgi:site-specific recombinase XerD
MMVERCRIRVEGPLAPYSAGFWAGLLSKGYTRLSAEKQVGLMARLSRWLEGDDLEASELTAQLAEEFLQAREAEGYATYTSPQSLGVVLGHLRACGAAPEPVVVVDRPSVEALVDGYVRHLADDRGLAPGTIAYYADRARVFLSGRPEPLVADLRRLTASEVTAYVMDGCGKGSVDSAKRLTTSMRSLLRFLFAKGWVTVELAPAVPTVAGWRASLPRAVEPGWVDQLLDSCDRDRVVGRRDYAILLLLSRLGLRAGEVAALTLDDVGWRVGELAVPRGKTRRRDRLPLAADVGEALADYLRLAPRRHERRALFMRVVAPAVGLTVHGVQQVVRHACERAGLPSFGPHRLRHTVAVELLRAGAGLPEIAQLLRQRSLSSTAIYAKVDRDSLRGLAKPWPGGAA